MLSCGAFVEISVTRGSVLLVSAVEGRPVETTVTSVVVSGLLVVELFSPSNLVLVWIETVVVFPITVALLVVTSGEVSFCTSLSVLSESKFVDVDVT